MADQSVRVVWTEPPDGSSPGGRPAELTVRWLDELPLPVVGELLETSPDVVLEVVGRSFYVDPRALPLPILLCKRVATVADRR